MKSGMALKKREFTLEIGNVELTPSREKAEGRNGEEDDRNMLIRPAAVPDKI